MMMTSLLPLAGAAVFLVFAVTVLRVEGLADRIHWTIPAAASLAFLMFSLAAATLEGPLGFWPEHTRNLWGNQIWFDLLLAVGVAWLFLVPQARGMRMRLPLWLVVVAATGCIGLLAMVARLQYLKARACRAAPLRQDAATA
jgi:hypothetical protein